MLDAPGGGGGTPWESMSVDDMQRLIQNPDTDKHYNLLDGWTKSAELVSSHRAQVQSYRDNLAAVWPPKKSAASAAYLARLDVLIDNLTETYEAALANHDALASATLSISLAQQSMEQIHQEYTINQQLLLDFSAKQQAQQNSPTPLPSPGPSGAEPPVAPGRQDALRQKAVTLLGGVSSDLAQAQVRVVRPTPYEPARRVDEPGSEDGGGYIPPPIPPITPSFADNSSAASSRKPSTAFPASGASQPTGTQQAGLILGGTPSPVLTPPPPSTLPAGPLPSGTAGPMGNPNIVPPTTSPALPNLKTFTPTNTGFGQGAGIPRDGIAGRGSMGVGGIHPMAPGGLIGGAPGAGIGPTTNRPGGRRINPVGGVIGEQAPPARNGGGGTAGQAYGQTGSRRPSNRDQGESNHWDPDNPWETAEGVDPVVLPSREQRIDPGPAIGLH